MPEPKFENPAQMRRSVAEALTEFRKEGDINKAIEYLRNNKDSITPFCIGLFEEYEKGNVNKIAKSGIDITGIIDIGLIIRQLL